VPSQDALDRRVEDLVDRVHGRARLVHPEEPALGVAPDRDDVDDRRPVERPVDMRVPLVAVVPPRRGEAAQVDGQDDVLARHVDVERVRNVDEIVEGVGQVDEALGGEGAGAKRLGRIG
jgi:hypothetical protein